MLIIPDSKKNGKRDGITLRIHRDIPFEAAVMAVLLSKMRSKNMGKHKSGSIL